MNKHMLRQAQQLQARLQKMQEELDTLTVEGSAGGGVVKVTVTGKQKIKSVTIAREAVEDLDMLQDLVTAAVNDALNKAQELATQKLSSVTGGMKIPGLM